MENQKHIILFDGVCNLCNASVQWVIGRDTENVFKFASLQSDFGQKFLKEHNFDTQTFDSFILLTPNKFYTKSDAAIMVGKTLGGKYGLLSLGLFLPKFLRNKIYSFIAKNRYRWFGKAENCWLPTPELQQKFIV